MTRRGGRNGQQFQIGGVPQKRRWRQRGRVRNRASAYIATSETGRAAEQYVRAAQAEHAAAVLAFEAEKAREEEELARNNAKDMYFYQQQCRADTVQSLVSITNTIAFDAEQTERYVCELQRELDALKSRMAHMEAIILRNSQRTPLAPYRGMQSAVKYTPVTTYV